MSGTRETINHNDQPRVNNLNTASRGYAPIPRLAEHEQVFAELKQYLDFDADDIANLAAIAPVVKGHLGILVDRLVREIPQQSGVDKSLDGDEERLARLRKSLEYWFDSLCEGRYDDEYVRRRAEIGREQAWLGMPHYYLSAAMDTVRRDLIEIISAAGLSDTPPKLDSLHKLLTIDNALLTNSYHQTIVDRVRASERSAVQERLTQAEHLARIGRLAASLAHEIKNPLAGISGAIQVIRDSMEPEAPHRPILAEILRQINRLDQTVKDLLVYGRPVPPRFGRCNLDRVIERLMTVLKREPEMQRVRFEHQNDHRPLPAIEADENQIEQLLMNLVLNAAHASEDGGLVMLKTKPIATGVQLEIEDHGHGMNEETAQRALEPFFTTKSRGTGLGLPICRRIVEMHSGSLTIHSTIEKGTTVSLQLALQQPAQTEGWE